MKSVFSGIRKTGTAAFLAAVIGLTAAVCGAGAEAPDILQADISYLSKISKEAVRDTIRYADEWFRQDPGIRNDSLALASAQMASVSGDPEQAAEVLGKLGFTAAEGRRFDSGEADDCAYTVGTKPLSLDGRQATLVALFPQGREYGEKGWLQNVTVNPDGDEVPDHGAYAAAAQSVLADLEGMLPEGDRVFWICGMSRGGAIAGLISARLLDTKNEPAVFCYTFEAPAETEDPSAHGETYRGIFNYICGEDPVPRFPLWGMTRYGEDVPYDEAPLEEIMDAVLQQNPQASDYLEAIDPGTFRDDMARIQDWLAESLEELIPSRNDYAKATDVTLPDGESFRYSRQEGLRALMRILFRRSGGDQPKIKPGAEWQGVISAFTSDFAANRRDTLLSYESDPSVSAEEKRWEFAGLIAPVLRLVRNTEISREEAYALLEMADCLIAPESFSGGTGASRENDPETALELFNSLYSYGSRMMFAHQIEVIIARMKSLVSPGTVR